MQHLAYRVIYSVVPVTSSLLAMTLYSLIQKTLIYNNTNYSVPFIMLYLNSTVFISKAISTKEERHSYKTEC